MPFDGFIFDQLDCPKNSHFNLFGTLSFFQMKCVIMFIPNYDLTWVKKNNEFDPTKQ